MKTKYKKRLLFLFALKLSSLGVLFSVWHGGNANTKVDALSPLPPSPSASHESFPEEDSEENQTLELTGWWSRLWSDDTGDVKDAQNDLKGYQQDLSEAKEVLQTKKREKAHLEKSIKKATDRAEKNELTGQLEDKNKEIERQQSKVSDLQTTVAKAQKTITAEREDEIDGIKNTIEDHKNEEEKAAKNLDNMRIRYEEACEAPSSIECAKAKENLDLAQEKLNSARSLKEAAKSNLSSAQGDADPDVSREHNRAEEDKALNERHTREMEAKEEECLNASASGQTRCMEELEELKKRQRGEKRDKDLGRNQSDYERLKNISEKNDLINNAVESKEAECEEMTLARDPAKEPTPEENECLAELSQMAVEQRKFKDKYEDEINQIDKKIDDLKGGISQAKADRCKDIEAPSGASDEELKRKQLEREECERNYLLDEENEAWEKEFQNKKKLCLQQKTEAEKTQCLDELQELKRQHETEVGALKREEISLIKEKIALNMECINKAIAYLEGEEEDVNPFLQRKQEADKFYDQVLKKYSLHAPSYKTANKKYYFLADDLEKKMESLFDEDLAKLDKYIALMEKKEFPFAKYFKEKRDVILKKYKDAKKKQDKINAKLDNALIAASIIRREIIYQEMLESDSEAGGLLNTQVGKEASELITGEMQKILDDAGVKDLGGLTAKEAAKKVKEEKEKQGEEVENTKKAARVEIKELIEVLEALDGKGKFVDGVTIEPSKKMMTNAIKKGLREESDVIPDEVSNAFSAYVALGENGFDCKNDYEGDEEECVKAFQKSMKIEQTGSIDDATIKALDDGEEGDKEEEEGDEGEEGEEEGSGGKQEGEICTDNSECAEGLVCREENPEEVAWLEGQGLNPRMMQASLLSAEQGGANKFSLGQRSKNQLLFTCSVALFIASGCIALCIFHIYGPPQTVAVRVRKKGVRKKKLGVRKKRK